MSIQGVLCGRFNRDLWLKGMPSASIEAQVAELGRLCKLQVRALYFLVTLSHGIMDALMALEVSVPLALGCKHNPVSEAIISGK